jgi:hypothetical protein
LGVPRRQSGSPSRPDPRRLASSTRLPPLCPDDNGPYPDDLVADGHAAAPQRTLPRRPGGHTVRHRARCSVRSWALPLARPPRGSRFHRLVPLVFGSFAKTAGFGPLFLPVSTEDLPPRASRPLPLRPRLNKGSGCCRRRSLRIRRAGRRYPERHGERHAAARIGLQRFHACPARRVRASRRGFPHSLVAGFMDSTRPAAYPAAAGLPTWAQHSARSTSAYGRHR